MKQPFQIDKMLTISALLILNFVAKLLLSRVFLITRSGTSILLNNILRSVLKCLRTEIILEVLSKATDEEILYKLILNNYIRLIMINFK